MTFGPVSVLPEYQRKGYGKQLIEYSFEKAAALGYEAVVIFGSPANYVSRGFQSCKIQSVRGKRNVSGSYAGKGTGAGSLGWQNVDL